MMGSGFGMMGSGSLMMILIFALIGYLFYLGVNKQRPNQNQAVSPISSIDSDAIKIAKMRLANGEISVEEFEQIRRNLN